jgi:hypothetical protein
LNRGVTVDVSWRRQSKAVTVAEQYGGTTTNKAKRMMELWRRGTVGPSVRRMVWYGTRSASHNDDGGLLLRLVCVGPVRLCDRIVSFSLSAFRANNDATHSLKPTIIFLDASSRPPSTKELTKHVSALLSSRTKNKKKLLGQWWYQSM